jgi:hypothetical protein
MMVGLYGLPAHGVDGRPPPTMRRAPNRTTRPLADLIITAPAWAQLYASLCTGRCAGCPAQTHSLDTPRPLFLPEGAVRRARFHLSPGRVPAGPGRTRPAG